MRSTCCLFGNDFGDLAASTGTLDLIKFRTCTARQCSSGCYEKASRSSCWPERAAVSATTSLAEQFSVGLIGKALVWPPVLKSMGVSQGPVEVEKSRQGLRLCGRRIPFTRAGKASLDSPLKKQCRLGQYIALSHLLLLIVKAKARRARDGKLWRVPCQVRTQGDSRMSAKPPSAAAEAAGLDQTHASMKFGQQPHQLAAEASLTRGWDAKS